MVDEWVSNFMDMAQEVELEGEDRIRFTREVAKCLTESADRQERG